MSQPNVLCLLSLVLVVCINAQVPGWSFQLFPTGGLGDLNYFAQFSISNEDLKLNTLVGIHRVSPFQTVLFVPQSSMVDNETVRFGVFLEATYFLEVEFNILNGIFTVVAAHLPHPSGPNGGSATYTNNASSSIPGRATLLYDDPTDFLVNATINFENKVDGSSCRGNKFNHYVDHKGTSDVAYFAGDIFDNTVTNTQSYGFVKTGDSTFTFSSPFTNNGGTPFVFLRTPVNSRLTGCGVFTAPDGTYFDFASPLCSPFEEDTNMNANLGFSQTGNTLEITDNTFATLVSGWSLTSAFNTPSCPTI